MALDHCVTREQALAWVAAHDETTSLRILLGGSNVWAAILYDPPAAGDADALFLPFDPIKMRPRDQVMRGRRTGWRLAAMRNDEPRLAEARETSRAARRSFLPADAVEYLEEGATHLASAGRAEFMEGLADVEWPGDECPSWAP